MSEETNILIVGSGVAGSLVANMLLNAGVDNILMLEAGPAIPMENNRAWFDAITSSAPTPPTPYDTLYDTKQDFDAIGPKPWSIVGGRIIGRGGSTVHWGGWAPRFMPEDFQLATNTGQGIDWPFSYADLEPYYCAAETYLGVAGVPQPGQRDWRSQPYPMVGPVLPLSAGPLVEALNLNGYSFGNMPVARNTVPYNGKPQCITTGTCYYCPIGARFTGDQPLDRLQATSNGRFTLRLNSPVLRLLMSSRSTVAGVEYLDPTTGTTGVVHAAAVFLCAGAFEVPKLLQMSTGPYWPNGVGNDSDLVGRYLVANPYIYCHGESPTNPRRLQQELNFPNLSSRQWDTPEEQATGKFLMNMSYETPLVNPGQLMYQGMSSADITNTVQGPMVYELQGGVSPLPNYENRVTAAPGTTRFGLPRTLFTTPFDLVPDATIQRHIGRMQALFAGIGYSIRDSGSYPQRGDHAASTCRMAPDASQGVVDSTLKIFGTDNLYIASNAVLPTLGAANLTLTLVATIMRALDILIVSGTLLPPPPVAPGARESE